MPIIYVILLDRIKLYNLNDKLKKFNMDSFVEIQPEKNGQYSIKNTGVVINKSYEENQELYNIKYAYIVDPNQEDFPEIQDHAYTFLFNENKKYDIVNEPIKTKPSAKDNGEVFNAIFVNGIACKLPLDIYKIIEHGNNQYLIKPCLIYRGKLKYYEIDSDSKEALVYKVDNAEIRSLYYNQIVTFTKYPNSDLYRSIDFELQNSDKIYSKK